MLFSGDGNAPLMRSFTAGPDWQDVHLPLHLFGGAELGHLRAVGLTAGSKPDAFRFEIDQVVIR